MAQSKVAIGIDLGTTFSSVGVWRNGRVEVIQNSQPPKATPSYIAFTDGERLIGEAARAQVATNPTNTVWSFKSLLGRSFEDPVVQEGIRMKRWSYKVINVGGKPNVEVVEKGETKFFTPEEICSILLMHLKRKAEDHIGQGAITDAVITIPASFNSSQVLATKRAAELAGLNVLRFISDPNAAALSNVELVGMDKGREKKLLVLNVGGGTTGVSVLTVGSGTIEVKASLGNANLGGEHLDNRMAAYLCKEIEQKHNRSLGEVPYGLQRLRKECEGAKRFLSSHDSVKVHLDDLFPGIDFVTKIRQDQFGILCKELFDEVVDLVSTVLQDAEMEYLDLDEILLVGGSSRIPAIQELFPTDLDQALDKFTIDVDDGPVQGAAILAALLSADSRNPSIGPIKRFKDVTPFSLGVETDGGATATLVPRHSFTPTKWCQTFTTAYGNQSDVIITIYEGEAALTKDNNLLGTFSFSKIPPAPAGVPMIDIIFEIDAIGSLVVTAVYRTTRRKESLAVSSGMGDIKSQEDIAQKLMDKEKGMKIKNYQKEYASVKRSYENISKLFYSVQETTDFLDKKMKELDLEEKRNERMLAPQEYPIVIASPTMNPTSRKSNGGGPAGVPKPKKRRI